MTPARMSLPAKLAIVLGAAMAGVAAWYGNEALAVMSALVGWQSWRLARLAVQTTNMVHSSREAVDALNLLVASQKSIILFQGKELEMHRTQALIRETEFAQYRDKAARAVGAAEMILNGRK